jgi:catechol 2,3-dioxygenase-like lactoylglutathione lyase family enzyme
MEFSGITHTVSDIEAAKAFYEDILGFEPGPAYAPTNWQSYRCQEGVFFAIGLPPGSTDETSFVVEDVEALWLRVKDRVTVIHPLEKTPWGTYRFVIEDPDGHILAFGQK